MSIKYDLEMRAKAVRLFHDHVSEYPSRWAAMKTISARLGMTAESLRQWGRQCLSKVMCPDLPRGAHHRT